MTENDYREIVEKFMRINRLHRNAIEKNFSEMNIHRSQHMILEYLSRCSEAPSQKQIAEQFKITPAAIAMSLKKMENSGLIERSTKEFDNRINKIIISEKGKEIVKKSHDIFKDISISMFSKVDDEDIKNLNIIFDKLIESLTLSQQEVSFLYRWEMNCEKGTIAYY